jgi:cell division protein FtsB
MAAKGKKKAKPRRKAGKYLRARTNGLRLVNRLAFAILILMGCVAIALLAMPQVGELRRLEGELIQSEARERETLARKDRGSRELSALKNNPEYLELIARDRLDLYKPGETPVRVIRTGN